MHCWPCWRAGFLGCYIHFFKAYHAWGETFLLSGCVGVSLVIGYGDLQPGGTVIPRFVPPDPHRPAWLPARSSTINDLAVAVVVYYGLYFCGVLISMFHLG